MQRPLSKLKLQSHDQCDKHLWLELNAVQLADTSEENELILDRGNRFSEAVRTLLVGGILIDTLEIKEALARINALLSQFDACGSPVPLFEAAFIHANVLVRVDILDPSPNGGWRIIEIKSGVVKPGEAPKQSYIRDAAIQAYVLNRCGIKLAAVELGTPSPSFTLEIDNSYNGLLARRDITTEVWAQCEAIEFSIAATEKTIEAATAPTTTPKSHCDTPHRCPFVSHCTETKLKQQEYIRAPVWHLAKSPTVKIVNRLLPNYRDLADVPEDLLSNSMHRIMRKIAREDIHNWIDPSLIKWLRNQPFPRYFLDYEFISSPLPIWRGTKQSERVAFQASLHVWRPPELPVEHYEFISDSKEDPRPKLAKTITQWMADLGPVFAWSGKSADAPITEGLIVHYPPGAEILKRVADSCRAHDPLPMFREHLYLASMKGDWGLKAGSSALQEKNLYADLEICNGVDLVRGYERLLLLSPCAERDKLKEALLKYCRLDTSIMIDIWNRVLNYPDSVSEVNIISTISLTPKNHISTVN